MEDTFLILPDLIQNLSIFAIFDGHGGSEVSKYMNIHFKDYFM